jgi:serine/threonine protein kinase
MSEDIERGDEIRESKDRTETSLSNPADLDLHPKPVKKKPSISDYMTIKCLGTGSFGEVILAKSLLDKRKYAIKILSKNHMEKVAAIYG